METLRLDTHGIAMEHFSRMIRASPLRHNARPKRATFFLPLSSSPLSEQVRTTENSSLYTWNVTRADNEIKYECQIWNQALTTPLRLEQYLHVQCKHRRRERQGPSAHRFLRRVDK